MVNNGAPPKPPLPLLLLSPHERLFSAVHNQSGSETTIHFISNYIFRYFVYEDIYE